MRSSAFLIIGLTVLVSCNSTFKIRKGATGHIIDSSTNLPIDSAAIGFLVGYKSDGMAAEAVDYSDKNGYFKIAALEKKTNYDAANTLRRIHSNYLKVEIYGFVNDTIFIDNSNYSRSADGNLVLLDTIYLKPM